MDNLGFTNGVDDDSTATDTENGSDGDGESAGKEDDNARRNIDIKYCWGAATGCDCDLSTTYDRDDYLDYADYPSDGDSDLSSTDDSDDDRCRDCDEVFEKESDTVNYHGHDYHRECLEQLVGYRCNSYFYT
jgi:hypothetical protein